MLTSKEELEQGQAVPQAAFHLQAYNLHIHRCDCSWSGRPHVLLQHQRPQVYQQLVSLHQYNQLSWKHPRGVDIQTSPKEHPLQTGLVNHYHPVCFCLGCQASLDRGADL